MRPRPLHSVIPPWKGSKAEASASSSIRPPWQSTPGSKTRAAPGLPIVSSPPAWRRASHEKVPIEMAPPRGNASTIRPTQAAIRTRAATATVEPPSPQQATQQSQAVPSKCSRAESDDLFGRVLELRNFPPGWMVTTAGAPTTEEKISKLLEKFGALEQAPTIFQSGEDFVVTVTYLNRIGAEAALKKLDGVDNRTKAERTKQPSEALEHQKLCVKVVPPERLDASLSGNVSHASLQVVGSTISGQTTRFTPIVSSKVAEATLRNLKPSELIQKAYVVGATQDEVDQALDDFNLVELILSKGYEAESPEVDEVKEDYMGVDEEPDEEPDVGADGDEEPLNVYVDELMPASEEPGIEDCEVFLDNLPIEEYDERALLEWLGSFGACKDVHLTKDALGELTGQGYVCFTSHDEALDLFDSLSEDAASIKDESMKIRAAWSLSERMKKGREGQPRPDAIEYVQARLRLEERARRAPGRAGRGIVFVQDRRPLHFACFADHGLGTPENLRAYLTKVLQTAFDELHGQVEASTSSKATISSPAHGEEVSHDSGSPLAATTLVDHGWTSTSAVTAPAQLQAELPCKAPTQVLPQPSGGLDSSSKKRLPAAIVEPSGCPAYVAPCGGVDSSSKKPPPPAIVEPVGGLDSSSKKPAPVAIAEPSGGPACVVVRGFTQNWQANEVKCVFAIYGGVVALRFVEDAIGRSVIVELKSAEKAQIAIAKMNNTQVGDGEMIEECTLRVQAFGASIQLASLKAIFLDELPMEGRPQLAPSSRDCEVFLLNLPTDDCTEANIGDWLKGFGLYKDFNLLRDNTTGALSKKGYVRFLDHKHAIGCVKACGEEYEDEANIVAQWSESERAEQRSDSVYGFDVHDAFTLKQLEDILCETKVQHLWIYSPAQKAPPDWPSPQGDQFHFLVACTEEQVVTLRARLEQALRALYLRYGYRPTATSTAAGSGESAAVETSSQSPPKASAEPGVAKVANAGCEIHPIYGRLACPEALAKIDEGEALVAQAAKLKERDGFEEAIKLYHKGIQCLMESIPMLEKPLGLRQRIATFLSEAEKLTRQKHEKDAKDLLRQGDEAETQKKPVKAFDLWKKGLQELNKVIKASNNPPSELSEMFKKYLEKAEGFKSIIKVATDKKGTRQMDGRRSRSRDAKHDKKEGVSQIDRKEASSTTALLTPVSGIGAMPVQEAKPGGVTCFELQGNAQKRARHDSPKATRPVAKTSFSFQDAHTRTKAASSAPLVAMAKSSFTGIVPGPPPSAPPPSTQAAVQAAPAPARRALLVGKAKSKAKS